MKVRYISIICGFFSALYIPHGSDERHSRFWRRKALESLYIPHGSDESCRSLYREHPKPVTLYPTWFRWKWQKEDFSACTIYFISHMVQMKAILLKSRRLRSSTLYPTWFRWKQNTCFRICPSMYNFISHMVQMKAVKRETFRRLQKALYPTWFRWKLMLHREVFLMYLSLYPTWFRWKIQKMEFNWRILVMLYIPHGSDERIAYFMRMLVFLYFISHMVQMKDFSNRICQ